MQGKALAFAHCPAKRSRSAAMVIRPRDERTVPGTDRGTKLGEHAQVASVGRALDAPFAQGCDRAAGTRQHSRAGGGSTHGAGFARRRACVPAASRFTRATIPGAGTPSASSRRPNRCAPRSSQPPQAGRAGARAARMRTDTPDAALDDDRFSRPRNARRKPPDPARGKVLISCTQASFCLKCRVPDAPATTDR